MLYQIASYYLKLQMKLLRHLMLCYVMSHRIVLRYGVEKWVGLGWVGLGWVGLGWVGLDFESSMNCTFSPLCDRAIVTHSSTPTSSSQQIRTFKSIHSPFESFQMN